MRRRLRKQLAEQQQEQPEPGPENTTQEPQTLTRQSGEIFVPNTRSAEDRQRTRSRRRQRQKYRRGRQTSREAQNQLSDTEIAGHPPCAPDQDDHAELHLDILPRQDIDVIADDSVAETPGTAALGDVLFDLQLQSDNLPADRMDHQLMIRMMKLDPDNFDSRIADIENETELEKFRRQRDSIYGSLDPDRSGSPLPEPSYFALEHSHSSLIADTPMARRKLGPMSQYLPRGAEISSFNNERRGSLPFPPPEDTETPFHNSVAFYHQQAFAEEPLAAPGDPDLIEPERQTNANPSTSVPTLTADDSDEGLSPLVHNFCRWYLTSSESSNDAMDLELAVKPPISALMLEKRSSAEPGIQ